MTQIMLVVLSWTSNDPDYASCIIMNKLWPRLWQLYYHELFVAQIMQVVLAWTSCNPYYVICISMN